MNRISLAFRSFFSILFGGTLPSDIAQTFGYSKGAVKSAPVAVPTAPPPPQKQQATPADGAVQILGLLQRESRLVDFLMEDIAPFSDEQVGAAVRDVQAQAQQSLDRYLRLASVLDAVEDSVVETAGLDAASYKLIGNVPADGQAQRGLLRHKGWKATKVALPPLKTNGKPSTILAPAELEVE